MTLVIDLPDSWKSLLGLDTSNASERARQMIIIEGYREGRLSRGQAAEMLELGFHETEALLKRFGADQQPAWEELESDSRHIKSLLDG